MLINEYWTGPREATYPFFISFSPRMYHFHEGNLFYLFQILSSCQAAAFQETVQPQTFITYAGCPVASHRIFVSGS